jgi:hypothetical protein
VVGHIANYGTFHQSILVLLQKSTKIITRSHAELEGQAVRVRKMADIKNGNFKESLYVQRKSRLRNGDSLIRLFSPYIFKYKTTNDISLTEPTPNKAWHKAIANTTGNSTSCPKTLLTSQPTKKYKNMIEDPLMKSLLPTLVSIMLYTTCLKHEKKQKKLP